MSLRLKRPPRYAPREPRFALTSPSVVLLPDDREVHIEIRNLSAAGFMALVEVDLDELSWMGVSIPGRGIVRAQVRWFEDGMFGARFEATQALSAIEKSL